MCQVSEEWPYGAGLGRGERGKWKMMDGQETVHPSAGVADCEVLGAVQGRGEGRGIISVGHSCCAFGLAHPLRVCTRLVEVWPCRPVQGWAWGKW